ncbi:urease accessory protein UreF [Pseudoalteromonas phenolica]|uniref:Urease accessory protein UreF n=1 Tax=Pseudoalteromonas phenolica TaxID=161398 RepID=A0A0S2K818_9GAMM|nr:urease accessory UreF family protein [Pseudoalteromonas phenolica]ALO44454.1 urease accessory protein UreF [Pseudoalteromonas phenolica]MBE0357472.1 urease accessory protein [Pseudoalteromonas phenolica O-BC30]RXF04511.1 urease accessory protein UreF [Pseudoalteromonas phenolica O-BC30]
MQFDPIKLSHLLQLCSANLPVGGFSFSQGLEFAVEQGWVSSEQSTLSWIIINLENALAQVDLPLLKRLLDALQNKDLVTFMRWNDHSLASRESHELLLADLAMGSALIRLLKNLNDIELSELSEISQLNEVSFVSAFALAAYTFDIDPLEAQSGYCWTFIDNQVAAATKLVPLGQTQAQNLLFKLADQIPKSLVKANHLKDDEIGASLPHLAMASAWHETQYSRLFRS